MLTIAGSIAGSAMDSEKNVRSRLILSFGWDRFRLLGSGSEELILEKLDQDAALATLADFARRNPLLARTQRSRAHRPLHSDRRQAAAPALGGRSARPRELPHLAHALAFLRTCPPDNDPLEFIFGDLAKEFTDDEEKVLCALTYFSLPPAKVEHNAEIGIRMYVDDTELRLLACPVSKSLTYAAATQSIPPRLGYGALSFVTSRNNSEFLATTPFTLSSHRRHPRQWKISTSAVRWNPRSMKRARWRRFQPAMASLNRSWMQPCEGRAKISQAVVFGEGCSRSFCIAAMHKSSRDLSPTSRLRRRPSSNRVNASAFRPPSR